MTGLRIVAIPQDPNPYQQSLYTAMSRRGASVRYGAQLTRSHTVNLLLLPAELAVRRLRGFRILHLHWTFGFRLPLSARSLVARRISRWWFGLVLQSARLVGFRIVWTAHNALPHEPVFDDDLAARRQIMRHASLVIVLSASGLGELLELALTPRRVAEIPQGLGAPELIQRIPPPPGHHPRTLMFFGKVEPYKGVEDLLRAAPDTTLPWRLVIAGACSDPLLRRRLGALAETLPDRVTLLLAHVPDTDLANMLEQSDCLVFPFRKVTNSSSVLFGMAAGRPVVVPALPAFAHLPDDAVFRYRAGDLSELRATLTAVAAKSSSELSARGAAAREHALSFRWEEIAVRTEEAMLSALQGHGVDSSAAV